MTTSCSTNTRDVLASTKCPDVLACTECPDVLACTECLDVLACTECPDVRTSGAARWNPLDADVVVLLISSTFPDGVDPYIRMVLELLLTPCHLRLLPQAVQTIEQGGGTLTLPDLLSAAANVTSTVPPHSLTVIHSPTYPPPGLQCLEFDLQTATSFLPARSTLLYSH